MFGYSIAECKIEKKINFKQNKRARLSTSPLSFLSVDGHNSFNLDFGKKRRLLKVNPVVICHFIMK